MAPHDRFEPLGFGQALHVRSADAAREWRMMQENYCRAFGHAGEFGAKPIEALRAQKSAGLALVERIEREQGRLDILVNSATQLSEDLLEPKPFFEKPLSNLEMWDVGMRSYYVASWHAAKLMVRQKSGLIVMISGYTGVTYTYGVLFSVTKGTVDRIARDMVIISNPTVSRPCRCGRA